MHIILIFLLWAICIPVNAVEFTVNTTDDSVDINLADGICLDGNGLCSLRAAVMQSNILGTDDVIYLSRGNVYELMLNDDIDNQAVNDLDVFDSLTISIADPDMPILSLSEMPAIIAGTLTQDRVIEISAGELIAIQGIFIGYGNAEDSLSNPRRGGGIYVADQVTEFQLINSIVAFNQGGFGAGIYSEAEQTVINQTDISYNTLVVPTPILLGAAGVAIYHDGQQMNLSHSSIHHNVVDTFGFFLGAIDLNGVGSQVNIVNTLIGENGVVFNGDNSTVSGIRADQSSVYMNNSNVSGNWGFGIEFDGGFDHELIIRNSVLADNQLANCDELTGAINFGGGGSGLGRIMSTDDSCELPDEGNLETLDSTLLSGIVGRFNALDNQFFSYQYPLLNDNSPLLDGGSTLDVNSTEVSACEATDFRGVSRPQLGYFFNACDVGMIESNDLIFRNGLSGT